MILLDVVSGTHIGVLQELSQARKDRSGSIGLGSEAK